MIRVFLFAAFLLGTSAAWAQTASLGETPRYVNLEFKLGSFYPFIDSQAGLVGTPYQDTFGYRAGMLRFEFEAVKYIYQGYGAVAVGIGAGYAEIFTHAKIADTNETSGEATGLRFFPLRILAEYRFDYMALHWNVPLVPYGKLALVCIPFQSVTGDSTDISKGVPGAGAKFGYAVTGGLALMLDFLEPRLARDMDSASGINHTYLFAEFSFEQVNNFGLSGPNLSSRRFMFGLSFDL